MAESKGNLIPMLSARMPEEAIQRTRKSETKKGYDTDGYGYQFVADRFNEICGHEWGFSWKMENHIEGQYKSGQTYHEISVSVEIWVGDKDHTRGCAGGHTSSNYSDALKGAITNAFKKAASFWGVGRDAYAGTIDDDNVPLPESDHERQSTTKKFEAPVVTDEQKKKVQALPESIRNWFRAALWRIDEVYEKCNELGWDNAKIMEFIEKEKAR